MQQIQADYSTALGEHKGKCRKIAVSAARKRRSQKRRDHEDGAIEASAAHRAFRFLCGKRTVLVCVSASIAIESRDVRTGVRVRVRGDILPVIKKRLVKTGRGSLSLSRRQAGVYVLIFLYYNIVPAAHLLEIKLSLPRSSAGRETPLYQPPETKSVPPRPGTKLTRTQHTRLPSSL